ncbi:MAG: fluoride efflux transporter CrcB [Brevundimonas sp.]|uniref:fluoride efflux transporter CrcB n=1 Tax=Brevundimonas sp. TaxID=1871086 RepID=UPI00391B5C0D
MTLTLIQILVIAVGGAIGGVARFGVSGIIARRFGEDFPWGTLVVNVSGAALIGVLAGVLLAPETHVANHGPVWSGLVIGILGSYTTVSSFSLQTLTLLRTNKPWLAGGNVIGSLALCVASAALGYAWTLRFLEGTG